MRLINTILYLVIAVALCAIALKSWQVIPVEAAKEPILKIDLVRIGGSPHPVTDLSQLLRKK